MCYPRPRSLARETFNLSAGIQSLARTSNGPNRAFVVDDRARTLQFHLEMTADDARRLVEAFPADLAPGPRIQPVAEQLANPSLFRRAHGILGRLLDALLKEGL